MSYCNYPYHTYKEFKTLYNIRPDTIRHYRLYMVHYRFDMGDDERKFMDYRRRNTNMGLRSVVFRDVLLTLLNPLESKIMPLI